MQIIVVQLLGMSGISGKKSQLQIIARPPVKCVIPHEECRLILWIAIIYKKDLRFLCDVDKDYYYYVTSI